MCWPAMKGGSQNCGRRLLPMLEILCLNRSFGTSAVGLLTRDHFL